jgi:hypothetical protein
MSCWLNMTKAHAESPLLLSRTVLSALKERLLSCSCDGIFIPDINLANLYSLSQDFTIATQCVFSCSFHHH